jgi:indoleacetamide hydrolase
MALISELGVREAADAIRTGGLTAETLADTLLARCATATSLNAFITLAPDDVRAAARRADEHRRRGGRLGPLHGVPLALKDNIDTADFPTTAGTPGLARHRPARNAPVVQRLLDAGALVLGKANLQELAYGPTTNNAAFGPTRNPYDRMRIPGGSSGGTGAAVAARLVPAGLGTDTAGSVRVPGALCGITTFRPSTLRWPQAGIVPISHTRDTAGPMTRSVADCVLLDGIVTGSATEVAPADLEGLRLGVPRGHFWENLDAELGEILEGALGRLRDAGVVLVEGDVAGVATLDAAAGFPIALYEFVADLERYLAEHATGLDFASLAAQVKSPAVGRGREPARRGCGVRGRLSRGARPASPGIAGNVSPRFQGARRRCAGVSDHAAAGRDYRRGLHRHAQRRAGADPGHLYPQPRPRQCRGPPWPDLARRHDQSRPPGRHRDRWATGQRRAPARDRARTRERAAAAAGATDLRVKSWNVGRNSEAYCAIGVTVLSVR